MSFHRRLAAVAATTAFAAATAVAGGTPAVAGGTTVTSPIVWTFTGAVSSTLSTPSNARLVDQSTYDDKLNAVPGSPEAVRVNGVTCAYGSAYASGLAIWGAGQWAHLQPGTTIGVRLQLACVIDGVLHRYNWGVERLRTGNYTNATNCVRLTRVSATELSLTADNQCPVQDEVLDPKPSKQLSATNDLRITFSSTVTIGTAPRA